jgi:hypothetical protein
MKPAPVPDFARVALPYACVTPQPLRARQRSPITRAFRRPNSSTALRWSRRRERGVGVTIPRCTAHRRACVARARLFQQLFLGPRAGADSKLIGERLCAMATDATARLKQQNFADMVPVPWGLLYVGEVAGGATLHYDNFFGMRHVIEVIPL